MVLTIALGVRGRRVALTLWYTVQVQQPLAHVQGVARHADEPLDQRRCRIRAALRFVRLIRRLEHDDVPTLRVGVSWQARASERDMWPIDELVHEEPVADQ